MCGHLDHDLNEQSAKKKKDLTRETWILSELMIKGIIFRCDNGTALKLKDFFPLRDT